MEPKKKDALDFVLPIILILFFLLISLHMAVSYEVAQEAASATEYTGADGELVTRKNLDAGVFFNDLFDRLTNHIGEIKFVKSTPTFLFWTCLFGFAIFSYFLMRKGKYIDGKEYGTSEWAKKKDIAHLWAKTLRKKELKDIKKKRISNAQKSKEMAQAELKYADTSDIIFTQTEKICMYNFELNNNTLIVGGSGSGKTRGYVLPNILQCCTSPYSPSIVVTDPKGDIIGKIGYFLEMMGYVIKVLNLKEQDRSFCFNPFVYVREKNFEEQVSEIVNGIMKSRVENNDQKPNDPFWEDMAEILLKALFYATYEGYLPEERNIPTVMQMFRWFTVSDNDDRYLNPTKLDRFFEVFGDKDGILNTVEIMLAFFNIQIMVQAGKKAVPQTLGSLSGLNMWKLDMMEQLAIPIGSENSVAIMRYHAAIYDLVNSLREQGGLTEEMEVKAEGAIKAIEDYVELRRTNYESPVLKDESGKRIKTKPIGVEIFEAYGGVNENPALRCWEDFRSKCVGKTAQSVISTALSKIAPFDEKQIRHIFSKDELELDKVGERRTALFIVLPPTKKTYNFVANVVYRMLFDQLEYCASVKHNQSLPVPVRFILDEFRNTGRIPDFENILSYARSFGIGISVILQSLDQIKELYEKSWGVILDNCSTFLYLGGIRHADTLEYISKLLGKGTFDKKTRSETKSSRQNSTNTNYDKFGRELMDASEIQRMKKKKCLLFINGYQPYYSTKFEYKTHKNYKYTSDCNKKYLYHYKTPDEMEINVKRKNSTHREEEQEKVLQALQEKQSPEIQKTPHIKGDYNAEKTVETMKNNVLFWKINCGDEAALAETELEELALIETLLKEEAQEQAQLRSGIREYVKTPHIESNTNVETVVQTVVSMVEESGGNVSFESGDEETEELLSKEQVFTRLEELAADEDEEYEDDTEKDMSELLDEANGLVNDLQELLTDFDIQSLSAGEVNSAEEDDN